MGTTRSIRGHTRDEVARTALRILDEYGLPDLTMRRLAAALDVQPSALYWHFPNKQSLLAELSDRIVAQVDLRTAHPDWASRIRAEAAALRRALLAHRDGAELVTSTLALGLGARMPQERFASAISAGDFDGETAQRAAAALLHFVLGHVLHEQQRQQYRELVVHHSETANLRQDDAPDAEFDFGVGLLVEGLRWRVGGRPNQHPNDLDRSLLS